MAELKYCRTCRHMHKRVAPQLFGGADLESAGILKTQIELDQENKQRAQMEMQRNLARQPFDYEPYNYEWCAAYTKIDVVNKARAGDAAALDELLKEGGARVNPVSGEISPLYILCAWKNETGACPKHEPK